MEGNSFKIAGLAGSLRRASFHRGLIRAARELAPEGVTVEPYERLAEIPFFNQDVEDRGDPAPVKDLKETIRQADAVLIATPEVRLRYPRRADQRSGLGAASAFTFQAQAGGDSGDDSPAAWERREGRWSCARSCCTLPLT